RDRLSCGGGDARAYTQPEERPPLRRALRQGFGGEGGRVIRFALVCESAHDFESWFRDGAAYEEQRERGLLSCPVCQSAKIEKAIMAPQVARKDRGETSAPAPAVAAEPAPVALMTPEQAQLRAKLKELRELMVRNSDDVGEKFAEEARRMH